MDVLKTILIFLGIVLLVALVILALLYRRLRRIKVDPEAGFFETLRHVPLGLVVALDLLDLALDVFAAPVTWVILDRLNLKGLRQVAAAEALIPITGPIPTLTLCWLAARRFQLGPETKPARNAKSSDKGPALGPAT